MQQVRQAHGREMPDRHPLPTGDGRVQEQEVRQDARREGPAIQRCTATRPHAHPGLRVTGVLGDDPSEQETCGMCEPG